MARSDVRDIDALEALRVGILEFCEHSERVLLEYRTAVQRAEEYFTEQRPAYWRHQTRLAERELNAAQDELSRKRSAARDQDRPSATEAVANVARAKRRLQLCLEKQQLAATVAREMSRQCEAVLGPIGGAAEQFSSVLPSAARNLSELVDRLRQYADQPPPDSV